MYLIYFEETYFKTNQLRCTMQLICLAKDIVTKISKGMYKRAIQSINKGMRTR